MFELFEFLKNGRACVIIAMLSILVAYLFIGPSHHNPGDMIAGAFDPYYLIIRKGIYFVASILLGWGLIKEIIDNS